MTNTKLLRWLAATTMLVATACSDSEPTEAATDDEPPTTLDAGVEAADEETRPAAEPLFAGLEESVTLLTETADGGHRPLLEWEPVADADHYSAYLYAPSGEVYWAWTGRDTSVPVGGAPRIDDGAPGPSVTDGMTWAVLAHDAAGLPLAVSEQRPIAP